MPEGENQALVDTQFGTFIYEESTEWFETKATLAELPISLSITAMTEDEAAPILGQARAFWTDQAGWLARLKEKAADDLLEIANEWNDEDDAVPIDRENFLSRLTLERIVMEGDDRFSAYVNDGDLFWGHTILVHGSISGGPQGAETAG